MENENATLSNVPAAAPMEKRKAEDLPSVEDAGKNKKAKPAKPSAEVRSASWAKGVIA
jgi:hypothetical protein